METTAPPTPPAAPALGGGAAGVAGAAAILADVVAGAGARAASAADAAPKASGSDFFPGADATLVLGLDGGGSGTRWCLMRLDGAVVAQGVCPVLPSLAPLSEATGLDGRHGPHPLTAAHASGTAAARASRASSASPGHAATHQETLTAVDAVLAQLALTLPQRPHAVLAGLTGFDLQAMPALRPRLAAAFGVQAHQAVAVSDIELLCRMAFAPGEGILVYAGTGSIAAHLRADGSLQRAGGRGAVIDDGGSGHWIACQALRHIWRMEDEAPGSTAHSPLAQALFGRIGGSDWARTRHWVAQAPRGQIGQLALQVAAAAPTDPVALELLSAAGRELARLAAALLRREGAQPIALAGRVFELHPEVERSLALQLPPGVRARALSEAPHHGAARLACESVLHRRNSHA